MIGTPIDLPFEHKDETWSFSCGGVVKRQRNGYSRCLIFSAGQEDGPLTRADSLGYEFVEKTYSLLYVIRNQFLHVKRFGDFDRSA